MQTTPFRVTHVVNESDADEDDANEDDANKSVVDRYGMDETVPPPVASVEGGGEKKEEEAEAAFVSFDNLERREARDFSNESRVTIFSCKKCTTDFRLWTDASSCSVDASESEFSLSLGTRERSRAAKRGI